MKPTSERDGPITLAQAIGTRPYQEDRAFQTWIELPSVSNGTGWLLGVFDGHSGAKAADKACKELPALFESNLEVYMGNADEAFDETFKTLHLLTAQEESGTTASAVYIPRQAEKLTWAILGDSPIAVLDAKGQIHIGQNHNVRTNREELAAAEKRGGVFIEGYLEDVHRPGIGLQMARTLGDVAMGRVLNREPDIEEIALGGRGIVLIGTDGLFSGGRAENDQLSRLLDLARQGADAQALVQDALARHTGDNVTAIVWKNLRGSDGGGSR